MYMCSYSLKEDHIDNGDRRDDDYLSGGVEGGVGASVDTLTNRHCNDQQSTKQLEPVPKLKDDIIVCYIWNNTHKGGLTFFAVLLVSTGKSTS